MYPSVSTAARGVRVGLRVVLCGVARWEVAPLPERADGLFIFPHTFDEHKSKDVQLTNTSPMCRKMIIGDVVRAALVVNLATRLVDFDSGDWTIKISGRPSDDVQSGELHFYFHMGNVTDSSPIN
jgi:hypothetical protein